MPELSRASIKETAANKPLFQNLAQLTSDSLLKICDLGLLTVEFLGVLPNQNDVIPDRYDVIRRLIITAMKEQPLTPTYKTKNHAPANNLLQAKASLKDLVSTDDVHFLFERHEKLEWAVGAKQKNSNVDRFLFQFRNS